MELVNYSIQDIVREHKNGKTIIGFGAGKALDTFCNGFFEYPVGQFFSAIADNDVRLSGTIRKTKYSTIPVYTIEEIVSRFSSVDIIIITTQYLQRVSEQLKSFPQFQKTKGVFYGFLIDNNCDWKLDSGEMDCDIVNVDGIHIPKVIHYCWFGKSKIPDRYREWMKSWKKYCPDYEIVEWNESNYDVNKNEYMAEAYDARKWGFVPDYARLDIIYHYGGIYLDTDVEVIQNLDSLLHQEAFCGFQDLNVALGLGFGAVAYNKYILEMRDDYSSRHFDLGDGKYDLTPSPKFNSETLIRHGLILNGRFQKLENISVYPKVFFSPMNHYNRKIKKNHNTFMIHHFDGSWVGKGEKAEWNEFESIYASLVAENSIG